LMPAGTALLGEAAPALDRLAAAARLHKGRGSDRSTTTLRVNALATFSLRWLLPRLDSFRADHPDIEVRLTTSNEPLEALAEPFDVVIRGGPDMFHDFDVRKLFDEHRLPVCSPRLLQRVPLMEVGDLEKHTLLHVSTMPRLWHDWLAVAGSPNLGSAASLTLDHFYLTVQAAIDGLGIAMGPSALIEDDLAAARLVAPFPRLTLPARGYYAYLPRTRLADPATTAFCEWVERAGRPGN
jgi:LysR family glycine cleavage system transcriptional activator